MLFRPENFWSLFKKPQKTPEVLLEVPLPPQVLRRAIKLSKGGGGTAVHAYRLLAQMKQASLAIYYVPIISLW